MNTFFVYLTLENKEVQNAIPVFSKGGLQKFTEFACLIIVNLSSESF